MKNETEKTVMRGELALLMVVVLNSLGVLLMLHSGWDFGDFSVPYAFRKVMPWLTLGTWTYIFQGLLVCTLMLMRKKFVPTYLFSFVVGFVFGELMDLHELWITRLPVNLPLRVALFCAELSDSLFRYCAFKPLQAPDCSDGSVPA